MAINIPMHARYHENKERYWIEDCLPCIVCGKSIKTPKHYIRVFYGTLAVTIVEADEIIAREGGGGDLLYYPIGSDCLRKHPELKPYADDEQQARLGEQS